MYKVFQFRLSEEARDHLNTVGWGGEFAPFPEIEIQAKVFGLGGSKHYKPWMEDHYKEVAEITGENLSMEDVFNVGNGYGKEGTCLRRFLPMHSMSVGDIVVGPIGNAYMCDSEGWGHIENFKRVA
tara:strand:+ start:511 stop:888 length:378 start_codon:yes stop_codon:yes gene_type:complete